MQKVLALVIAFIIHGYNSRGGLFNLSNTRGMNTMKIITLLQPITKSAACAKWRFIFLSNIARLGTVALLTISSLSLAQCDASEDDSTPDQYTCVNGIAASGTPDTEGEVRCASCNANFRLVGTQCEQEYPYVCTNGTATIDVTLTQNEQNCTSCNSGWTLNNTTNTCDGNSYTCPNGMATSGMPDTEGEARCDSCNTGYRLDGTACLPNSYICTNGIAATGTPDTNGEAKCASCNANFRLVGTQCEQGYPYVCTNGTATAGVTLTQNEQNCTLCNSGWTLNNTTNTCDGSSYTCPNGMATSGIPATDREVKCDSCNTGYFLNGSEACEALYTGSGTEDSPYTINNYTQLLCMGRSGATTSGVDCNAYSTWTLNKHYKLRANIDASTSCPGYNGTNGDTVTCGGGQTAWVPLGDCGADGICGDRTSTTTTDESTDDRGFTGSFDGADFTISKLYYKINASGTQYGGLFGFTSGATIKNVEMENVYVNVVSSSASSYAGGLVGRMGSGNISNSYATGNVSSSSPSSSSRFSSSYAGGLVGRMGSGNISNSYATGNVSFSPPSRFSSSYTGGLVGEMSSSSISNSYATGNVSSSAPSSNNSFVGGLVGGMQSSSISNSYATGNVSSYSPSSGDSYAGGLVGWMQSSGINNSYATGDVSSSYYAGGLVGRMQSSSSISNSYATGNVSSSSDAVFSYYAGGLVGRMQSSSISNSYATGNVSSSSFSSSLRFSPSYAGGLVGWMQSSSSISNSYATGNVSSSPFSDSSYAGGLVGLMQGSSNISNSYATGNVSSSAFRSSSYAGGLVGWMGSSTGVSNSYATGNVSSSDAAFSYAGGLVGWMSSSTGVRNSYATGNVSSSATHAGGLIGGRTGSGNAISNSYFNSGATQTLGGTAQNPKRGVGNESTDPSGVSGQTQNQIQLLPATDSDTDPDTPQLNWDATNHWSGAGTAGSFPKLRYGNNPHTSSKDECKFLPGYGNLDSDKVRCGDLLPTTSSFIFIKYGNNPHTSSTDECKLLPGYGNLDSDKVRCGDLLPYQELYRSVSKLTFSNAVISAPDASVRQIFYSVSGAASVSVTYNLATSVTLASSGIENEDGSTSNIVTWSEGTSNGNITGIADGESFWLRLTFQTGSGSSLRTHTVRLRFIAPGSDLVVETPRLSPSTVSTGTTFTLSAVVRNSGSLASTATTLRYYRSTNSTVTTSDMEVGTATTVSALDPGDATSRLSVSLTAPNVAGNYYYAACVVSVTNEGNTTNNCSTTVRLVAQ